MKLVKAGNMLINSKLLNKKQFNMSKLFQMQDEASLLYLIVTYKVHCTCL